MCLAGILTLQCLLVIRRDPTHLPERRGLARIMEEAVCGRYGKLRIGIDVDSCRVDSGADIGMPT